MGCVCVYRWWDVCVDGGGVQRGVSFLCVGRMWVCVCIDVCVCVSVCMFV